MRVAKWLFTLAAVAVVAPKQLEGQVVRMQADTACALTPRMLRQVAAAVDGYMKGERLRVVITCGDSSTVIGTFATEADALAAARASRTRAWVSPDMQAKLYDTAVRLGFTDAYTLECQHDGTASNWWPASICGSRVLRAADVLGMNLQFQMRNGQTITTPVPLKADVIFLQYSGIEKFAFTYYEGIVGPEGVALMRNEMFDRRRAAIGQR